jgi:hypothetical protein
MGWVMKLIYAAISGIRETFRGLFKKPKKQAVYFDEPRLAKKSKKLKDPHQIILDEFEFSSYHKLN